jgi:D-arabinitol 4-dehydrogenase
VTVAASSPLVILHLGLGAFHRAHQAVFLQRLIDAGDAGWVLKSGNIRPGGEDLIAALQAQGGAYTLETISPAGERRYQRIEAIRAVLPWDNTLAAVRNVGADPRTRIVSFTVTEAGYHLDAAGRLDLAAADVEADIAAARAGKPGVTIYGALAAICRDRMRVGAGGLTLLSCDNLRHNGARVRAGLAEFVDAVGDAALLAWLAANTTSPNGMVDRITPRPSPEIVERVQAATGCIDPAALTAESYLQWVIEDDFIDGRPAWEKVGVQMVGSVLPYEEAKIRLLNATHGCVAWAGALAGHVHIHESMGDARIRRFAFDYVTDDAIPALSPSPVDLPAYRDAVLERFGNASLRDTIQRVTSDSFSKLSGFVAPTLRDRLQRKEGIESVAVLPALFLAFLRRWHEGSLPFTYQEQAADLELARTICSAADPVAALAGATRLWGALAGDERLRAALERATARVAVFAAETSC